ncbi:MAG: hypothetical protein KME09_00135 [Pleurocapsa minor HA4230-MV1]|jgi:hypothetical protein|nr:hypothetical protein [Pleurocapsa minor HA4230-MV1]
MTKSMLELFPDQINPAYEILKVASLLIEREAEPLTFFLSPQDVELQKNSYSIANKITKSGNYLTVKSNDERMSIEMLDGNLVFAVGIEEADITYWQKLEQDLCS